MVFEGVTKTYRRGGETISILDQADLEVRSGEIVALIGRSGSGKSTTLYLAAALDDPDSGRVAVHGAELRPMSASARAELRRRHVGFIFQFFYLIPSLTVLENVALPLVLDHRRGREAAMKALDSVGLSHRAAHVPSELSGGEMQRAAIARAMVGEPTLLLADEPTGSLDAATGERVMNQLVAASRRQGCAVLLVTHDLGVAQAADRIVRLEGGRLVQ
ncbi:ABC transporter ATP-binding protein [Nocardia arthritidis]|uniref:ABC transporter ATP-binding protein n=1 Tax=Nocardia arthritidis TaxID=228602 RepID=UPI00142E184B|nr:ABC transporter ATP-binding protein [Nocardia arthritidis]